MIKHGVEKSKHGRRGAKQQEWQGPPPDGRSQEIEDDADQAIDCHLGHDTAHQGGDMAGGCRMGKRQPDVERRDTGFRAGAENGTRKYEPGNEWPGWNGADRVEGVVAGRTGKSTEGKQQRSRADCCHY